MSDFVHLHVHTEYSLLDGACRIKGLVSRLKKLGQTACAITDHGVMYGCIDFYRAMKEAGIKPILGCEVYVAPRTRFDKDGKQDSSPHHLILLCENSTGYQNLTKLVSDANINGFYSKPRCDRETLKKYHEGLICLSACLSGEVARRLLAGDYEAAKHTALDYLEIFGEGNYYLEVQDHGLSGQQKINPMLYRLSRETGIPVVATNDAHYLTEESSEIQRVLTAISTNTTINEKNPLGFNSRELYIKSAEQMATLFDEEAIANTVRIAARCNTEIEFGSLKLPKFTAEGVADNISYFKKSVLEGIKERYGDPVPEEALTRAEYEIKVITEMGYVDYFLIVADFIAYARSRGIPVGPGRGSGVGSICAYALKITGIDPLRYNLLFERFLNPERVTMPDIDIDFCYVGRQEVIDYVSRKYGADHVAQIITFGTLASKAAIRDVGRAMGLPYAKVDGIAKMIPSFQNQNLSIGVAVKNEEKLANAVKNDPETEKLINTALKLEGMPRHSSMHAAGVVITPGAVTDYVPVQKSDNCIVTQYPKDTLEQLGLLKMDFLALRNLTAVYDAQKLVRQSQPDFDIDRIPPNDKATFAMLSSGQTTGVFQFESAGMTSVLSRLKPGSIEDLIAVISLYRPGPMQSISAYIENRHHPEKITYRHPLLKDILDVTYGVMVYQEQVMQICRTIGGYSYGRADMVRRAMSKKKKDVMEKERSAFIYGTDTNCGAVKNGVPAEIAEEIFNEMSSFASYAFNKSHAAAYAWLAYQTAYLRCHHYKEHMISLMSIYMGNAGKLNEYVSDLEKHGVKLLPPDVNSSLAGFTAQADSIKYGLLPIKNLGRGVINSIVEERKKGHYKSLYDFCSRLAKTDLNKRALEALIKSGAMDCLGHTRHSMFMAYEGILSKLAAQRSTNVEGQLDMFSFSDEGEEDDGFVMPEVQEYTHDQLLKMEKESAGFYISGHPMDRYDPLIKRLGCKNIYTLINSAKEGLNGFRDGQKQPLVAMLSSKKLHTQKNGKQMCFAEFEDKSGVMEAILFSDIYEKYIGMLNIGTVYKLVGTVSADSGYREDDDPKLIVNAIEPANEIPDSSQILYIRLLSDEIGILEQAHKVLWQNQGDTQVKFCFDDTRKTAKPKGISGVKITKDMLRQLEKICGKDNIIMK